MSIIYIRLRRMRASGEMPLQVPESTLMQRLPQNPVVLGVIYAIIFAVFAISINAALLWFFNIQNMAFVPWTVYKLLYTTVLSIKTVESCIFRYVQPDWANVCHHANTETGKTVINTPVRNPLPKIGVFKEMYAAVTGNIAMNIIIGSALGGVTVGTDSSVVINPATAEGIPITGLVFGLIVGILVTNGIVTAMNATIIASSPTIPEAAAVDKRLAWMPRGRGGLTCLICVCVMVFSAVALRSIMMLFGISVMNFYQYTVFMTVYAALISKPLASVLIRRCMQPDYIQYTLKNKKIT